MEAYKIKKIPIDKRQIRKLKAALAKFREITGFSLNKVGQTACDFAAISPILFYETTGSGEPRVLGIPDPKVIYRLDKGHTFTNRSDHLFSLMVFLTTRTELDLFIEDLYLEQLDPQARWPEELSRAMISGANRSVERMLLEGTYTIHDQPNSNRTKHYHETHDKFGEVVRLEYTNDDVVRQIEFVHRGKGQDTYDVILTYEPKDKDSGRPTLTWYGHAFSVGDHHIVLPNGGTGTVCYHVWVGRESETGEKMVWGMEIEHKRSIDVKFFPLNKSQGRSN